MSPTTILAESLFVAHITLVKSGLIFSFLICGLKGRLNYANNKKL